MTIYRCSLFLGLTLMLLLTSCGEKERTVEEEIAEMQAQWSREDPPVFAAPSSEGETYKVPSDSGASYRLLRWKRLKGQGLEALIRRDGSSGTSFTRMLADCGVRRFIVLGEGGTQAKALADLHYESAWIDLVPGSIKDVSFSLVCKKGAR